MIDTVQAVLLFVIIILAVLFVVLGVQVFLILKELRITLSKTNKILTEVEDLTEHVAEPLAFITGFLFSSKTLSIIGKLFKRNKKET
ncbi:MAG: hypothetical protein ACM3IJ_06080 [Candidatus Levyibacteriota bacterium]